MDKTAYVKNELRNTEIYYKEIYGYKLKKQKLELDQANLRSPSLSNSGGQHNGSSNFDLLDYTNEIEALDLLIQLYSEKIRWNIMIVENAPIKVRTIMINAYINGLTFAELAKSFNEKPHTLVQLMSDYFTENVSDAQLQKSIMISSKIKRAQKNYYAVIRQRKMDKLNN